MSKVEGDACFINHSSANNTGSPPNPQPPVTTVTLRDLAAGEEITCDYWAYDADTSWKLGLVPRDASLGTVTQPERGCGLAIVPLLNADRCADRNSS